MSELPDQALARKAQAGSPEAFEELVARYERRVERLCERILGSRADAEDAAIATFVKAWRGLGRYDPSRPFAPWLMTIAGREAVTVAQTRPTWTSLDNLVEGGAELDGSPGHAQDPAELALTGETRETVLSAVERLDPASRAAVVLRYQLDLSYAEIAGLLGMPAATVGTLLHRARSRLRGWLTAILQPDRKEEAP
ncbi:MAG: RNA polymerase sigma factor [Chitinophagales bacterium]